jgi:hypothetical protein
MPSTVDDCIFCAMVAGRQPAHVVVDDEDAFGFLDRRPLFPGHTLVVPRDHVETLPDLPAERLGGFFAQVQRVARAMEDGLGAAGSFVAANNRVSQSARASRICTSTWSPATARTVCAASSGPAPATPTTTPPPRSPLACGGPSPSRNRRQSTDAPRFSPVFGHIVWCRADMMTTRR